MYMSLFLKPYVNQHVKMVDLAQHPGHVTWYTGPSCSNGTFGLLTTYLMHDPVK